MTIALDDFAALKRTVERLRREHAETSGALKQVKARMAEEWGVKTVKEARALKEKFDRERDEAYEEYLDAKAAFETKWGHLLEEGGEE